MCKHTWPIKLILIHSDSDSDYVEIFQEAQIGYSKTRSFQYDECWKSLVKSTGTTAPALECCSVISWQEQELLIGHKNGKQEPHRSRCDSTPNTNTFTPAAT